MESFNDEKETCKCEVGESLKDLKRVPCTVMAGEIQDAPAG